MIETCQNHIICVSSPIVTDVSELNQIFKEKDLPCLKKYIYEMKYNGIFPTFLIDAIISGIEENALNCIKYIIELNDLFCIQLIENAIIKISYMNPNEIRSRFISNIFNELDNKNLTNFSKERLKIIIEICNEMDVDK